MRTYRELGLDVPVRGDHVPEMAYDRELTPDWTPGYFTLGGYARIFGSAAAAFFRLTAQCTVSDKMV